MKDMNKLRYNKDATADENLLRFWLLFCLHVVSLQAVSLIYNLFIHSFPWPVIIACSLGGSIGWFLGPDYRIRLFRHS